MDDSKLLLNKTVDPPNMAPLKFYDEKLVTNTVGVNNYYDITKRARNSM